jgi:plastocyanin
MPGPRLALCLLIMPAALVACSGDPVGQPLESVEAPVVAAVNARDAHGRSHIAILDDCATDPAWAATGGCALREGAVTEADFGAFLFSPLSLSAVGHPAWRNEPSYLRVAAGTLVDVTNDGGRTHTFTRVAQYGGGRVPPLNQGLTPAPECAPMTPDPNQVTPGGRLVLNALAPGDHRYQCCIHPWMRALIKVQ